MTDQTLSPAAQAVLDAWSNVIRADNYGGRVEVPLATALRAAADSVNHATSAHTLHAIADELEGVKYGTYRCDLEGK
jgi:hypothetical protein